MKSISLSGRVINGKLMLVNKGLMDEFLKGQEDERVVMNITILSRIASERSRGYFRQVIVPELRQALKNNGELYTLIKTEGLALGMCVNAREEKIIDGKIVSRTKHLYELSQDELSGVIDELKYIASTELNHFIA